MEAHSETTMHAIQKRTRADRWDITAMAARTRPENPT
jgi:hypothetical protein